MAKRTEKKSRRERGTGGIYKRGNTYWLKFSRDGVPVFMSAETPSFDIAKARLKLELQKSDEEFNEPRLKRITVQDLFDELFKHYESQPGKERYLSECRSKWAAYLKPIFSGVKVVHFGTKNVNEYKAARKEQGASPSTVDRELQMLIKAFRLGYEMEPPMVKRVPSIKRYDVGDKNARRVFASPSQVTAIRTAAALHSPEMAAVVEILVVYGWRRGEVVGDRLKVGNLHFETNTIRLEDSKNGEAREVKMTPRVRELLLRVVENKQPGDRVFPFNAWKVNELWHEIVEAAGCPHLHMHDMRRTSARTKRSAGVDSSIIMKIQGWKTEKMFRRYGIVSPEDIAEALEKQERYEERLQNADKLQNGYNSPEPFVPSNVICMKTRA